MNIDCDRGTNGADFVVTSIPSLDEAPAPGPIEPERGRPPAPRLRGLRAMFANRRS